MGIWHFTRWHTTQVSYGMLLEVLGPILSLPRSIYCDSGGAGVDAYKMLFRCIREQGAEGRFMPYVCIRRIILLGFPTAAVSLVKVLERFYLYASSR
jgi:hypothetical protein